MKNIKTTWNLGLLYKNEKDPQIEKDLQRIEKASKAFEKKYRKLDFTKTPERLLRALSDREELSESFEAGKPWWYFALKTDLNAADARSEAFATKNDQRITQAKNRLTFFGIAVGKIPKPKQKVYLNHPKLKAYAYFLKRAFDQARYQLSEAEEQVINLLSQTSYTMWIDGQNKVLSKQTIDHGGQNLPFPKAMAILSDLKKTERRSLKGKIDKILLDNSPFAEAEINAIYNFKKVLDERRGFKRSYSSSLLSYENSEEEIETLVSLISKNFKIAHRFYKLHAKLLRQKKLNMEDRGVKIGEIKRKFDFGETLKIVGEALGSVNPKFKKILENYVRNGQIDVYPRKGKTSGAYCWGAGDLPTFVLLNHADTIRSVETLGHEMGHAIHTELSKSQPTRYKKYSLATAETASTFFEQVTLDRLEKGLTKKEQIVTLHNKIMGDISSIFRQIACFNFEKELHDQIRSSGQVSKEDIAELMRKHLKSYIGEAINVSREDGYFFVYWSHIRRFFYVYTYAYGQLISRVLFEKWKADPKFAKKIEEFLSAGRSMSPRDIFKSIGIDISDPKFFEAGLKGIEADIKRLEKLTSKA